MKYCFEYTSLTNSWCEETNDIKRIETLFNNIDNKINKITIYDYELNDFIYYKERNYKPSINLIFVNDRDLRTKNRKVTL